MIDCLSDHELRELLRAARQRRFARAQRDHALLALLANTGIRPGEAVELRASDLELSDHESRIRVRRLKKRIELGRIDDLPISRALSRTLAVYLARRRREAGLDPNPRLFQITVRSAERVFRYYARRAGISSSHRLYSLRHTALTRAYRVSRDLRLVQQLAGHASARTTEVYTHVDPQRTRQTVELAGAEI